MKKKGVGRTAKPYRFALQRSWLTMPDGVRLAMTTYMPKPKVRGETFPVVLEILPYRKDEAFHIGDYPSYSYLAQHGFITVKVDIRGTGGSDGPVPAREYSDIELDDAEEIIRQLAAIPGSNGNVAMWGCSWSGFNSLQVAMRRPPALKTIISIHASDDLFHDDVHYMDGIFHVDNYHLFINHELGLPRTPNYRLDRDYFRNRFHRQPWLFTYAKQQKDSDFWGVKSLGRDYSRINIPVYLIGGLLDGYRSAMVRIFENLCVPVKCEIGPWDHSCPDEGSPGPNYEYLARMVTWMNHWMRKPQPQVARELEAGKRMLVFVRGGHEPDANMTTTPGHWREVAWEGSQSRDVRFFPTTAGKLNKRAGGKGSAALRYCPGSGVTAGVWWGDTTGDVAREAAGSLVFDSVPLDKPVAIIGAPEMQLLVQSSARRANWTVRLEDVAPDGKVALITGGMINSSHRNGRSTPSYVVPEEPYQLSLKLHFTTWTFRPGHRIRLAVSNAQFPIAWPSPEPMTTLLHCGAQTVLTLPTVAVEPDARPKLPRVKAKRDCPDGKHLDTDGVPFARHWMYNQTDGSTAYTSETEGAYKIHGRRYDTKLVNRWTTRDTEPWYSEYLGEAYTSIQAGRGAIELRTTIHVQSDKTHFHIRITRALRRNGRNVRRRTWRESVSRHHQ
jgi:uncharacterized protein